MKTRLGDFELTEQIDPGGYTVVWKAIQHMGLEITRPAAVKILQNWRGENDEQISVLRKEVELLLAVGSCPYIVEVYGFGVDSEVGPWIGMELSGKSLRHSGSDQPANVDDVRQMLHDTLKALSVVHRADPQILHRDIKPNNIIRSRHGHWQIADFGLAKRQGSEDTMNFTTVQYAAPELLDATLGQESPKMDLYSLGMVAYEFALGKTLYRKQFASIYDPYATKSAETTSLDDKPKWMYWHTSAQMSLPKIKDLIADFPEDLSDLIAKMLQKPLRDRIGSADEALALIGEVAVRGGGGSGAEMQEIEAPPSKVNVVGIVAVLLWVITVVGTLGYVMWSRASKNPEIAADSKTFTTDKPELILRGTVKDLPEGAVVRVIHKGNTINGDSMQVDSSGRFAGSIILGSVGEQSATIRIVDGQQVLASDIVTVSRSAPKLVKIKFSTNPPAPVSDFTVREASRPNEPIKLATDQNGFATLDIAHGQFRVEMNHPRYKVADFTDNTGDDPEHSITIQLTALSEQRIADKREKLLSEMDSLVEKAAKGDPEAAKRLEEIRKELAQLEPLEGDNQAAKRLALMQELQEETRKALAGDPEAAKRVIAINKELRELATKALDKGPTASDPTASAERDAKRKALLDELPGLLDRAATGDPEAIKRLHEVQSQLASLEADDLKSGGGDNRRAGLVREMAGLVDRAAAGDPAAIARLNEIRAEMNQIADAEEAKRTGKPVVSLFQKREELIRELGEVIQRAMGGDNTSYRRMADIGNDLMALEKADTASGAIPKRRKELIAELQSTIALAQIGNADAKLRLPDLHRELATLSAIESAGGDADKLRAAAARMMTGDPGLDLIDRGTLLGLTSEQFKAFLEINIPNGTLKVEVVPHLTKIRLTGPVFNEEEYNRLLARLEPAKPRLQLEVRVDAWAVCHRLEDLLMKQGAEDVRVHAHLTFGDNEMFVQFKKTDRFTKDQVFVLSRPFVIDRDMIHLQTL